MNRDDAQSANHVAIFQTMTKKSTLVVEPGAVPAAMREAFRVALSGCPGPVHIDFAREVLDAGRCEISALQPSGYRSLAGPAGCEASIKRAIEVLQASHRPAIWAGRGALLSGAGPEIVAFAENLRAPVVTTYNGISCVPSDHPLAFGPRSRHGTRLSNKVLREADAVLVVGNSLNGISTDRWSMSLPKALIQIDIEPERIGRDYPSRIGIVGDARQVLSRMNSLCADRTPNAESVVRDEWLASLTKSRNEWLTSISGPEFAKHRPVKPQYVMAALRRSLPRDAIFAFDAGNPGIWSHLMPFYEPRTYMKPVGFGNMGFGLPAAIAAKLAMPHRTVVAVVGDGSLGMCLTELETAVRLGVQVTVIVLNDSGYGNIRQEQFVKFGPRYTGVDFGDIHYAEAAKALGADGVRVSSPEELVSALEHAKTSSGTFLIDVQIDTQDNVWLSPF
jgi:acetolactate synthase-1/2/3 large subunit